MSYIQIEIGGKMRGLKFNFATDEEYNTKAEGNTNKTFATYCLIWAALVSNCMVKGEQLMNGEVLATFENVCDWVDKISVDDLTKVQAAYTEAHAFAKDLPVEEDTAKKNLAQESTEPPVENSP